MSIRQSAIFEIPTLASVYPPFAAKMDEFRRLAERDVLAADKVFAEAQEMAKAFYAGIDFAGKRVA